MTRAGESIFWWILPYLIALFAWAVNRKMSDSDDPKKTAMQLGQVFANMTRSTLKNE